MENYTKNSGPNTKILRAGPGGAIIVAEIPGLPYGAPKIGTLVLIPQYGEVTCSGIQKCGSGINETINEVSFTLK